MKRFNFFNQSLEIQFFAGNWRIFWEVLQCLSYRHNLQTKRNLHVTFENSFSSTYYVPISSVIPNFLQQLKWNDIKRKIHYFSTIPQSLVVRVCSNVFTKFIYCTWKYSPKTHLAFQLTTCEGCLLTSTNVTASNWQHHTTTKDSIPQKFFMPLFLTGAGISQSV
jgi:hypothetical protein